MNAIFISSLWRRCVVRMEITAVLTDTHAMRRKRPALKPTMRSPGSQNKRPGSWRGPRYCLEMKMWSATRLPAVHLVLPVVNYPPGSGAVALLSRWVFLLCVFLSVLLLWMLLWMFFCLTRSSSGFVFMCFACVCSLQAVCCEDHEHCCPQGYTCDLEFGTCVKASGLHGVPLTLLQTHTDTRSEEEVLCDASTRCSKTQSCCRLSDSTWACCPYKEVTKAGLPRIDIWLIIKFIKKWMSDISGAC